MAGSTCHFYLWTRKRDSPIPYLSRKFTHADFVVMSKSSEKKNRWKCWWCGWQQQSMDVTRFCNECARNLFSETRWENWPCPRSSTANSPDGLVPKTSLTILRWFWQYPASVSSRYTTLLPFTNPLAVKNGNEGKMFFVWRTRMSFSRFPVDIKIIKCIFLLVQTIVSDCSFVASLAISAQYERRFKKKLITRWHFLCYIWLKLDVLGHEVHVRVSCGFSIGYEQHVVDEHVGI